MHPNYKGFRLLRLATERGQVDCRYYQSLPILEYWKERDEEVKTTKQKQERSSAVIFVTGVGGDWGTPAKDLYPRLCGSLCKEEDINGLRIRYRHPTDLSESVFDVLAGISYLKQEQKGIKSIGLVGHSFGGAVVLQAATVASDIVSTVVTLATQSYGAIYTAPRLKNGTSLLLVHGTEDGVLPVYCSEQVYQVAHEPKQLVICEGAGHSLDEVSEDVYRLVNGWLIEHLKH